MFCFQKFTVPDGDAGFVGFSLKEPIRNHSSNRTFIKHEQNVFDVSPFHTEGPVHLQTDLWEVSPQRSRCPSRVGVHPSQVGVHRTAVDRSPGTETSIMIRLNIWSSALVLASPVSAGIQFFGPGSAKPPPSESPPVRPRLLSDWSPLGVIDRLWIREIRGAHWKTRTTQQTCYPQTLSYDHASFQFSRFKTNLLTDRRCDYVIVHLVGGW